MQTTYLMKYPYIRKLVKEGTLNIMGWYYNIEEGEIYNYDHEKDYQGEISKREVNTRLSYIELTLFKFPQKYS